MPIKDTVNTALYRAFGYRLTRETPEGRASAIAAAERAAAKRARERTAERFRRQIAERDEKRREQQRLAAQRRAEKRARRQAEREERERLAERQRAQEQARREAEAERKEQERARGDDLPAYYDTAMRRMIARVRPRTMTGDRKLQALIEATRYVVRERVPGDIVECGVWRGGSMQAMALALLEGGDVSRELHLFDTFEGMPPPTAEDSRTKDGQTVTAAELLASSDKDSRMWGIAGLDDVKAGMAEVGYPAAKIHYHPGLVEETTPGEAPEQIAILRLDTDWYASTKHELGVLYERLSPGGVLIIDDYGDWDGARKAVDEWLAQSGEPLFLAPMGTGRIAIKPRPAPRVGDETANAEETEPTR